MGNFRWLFFIWILVSLSPLPAAVIYVAPNGNDSAAGSEAAPLATLAGARDKIRKLREGGLKEEARVLIRGGAYALPETFVLEPQDSGTHEYPVIFSTYEGERPTFSGGKRITGWRKGENGRWLADVPDVASGNGYFTELFVNGERRTRARTPNSGFYKMAGRVVENLNDPKNNRGFRFQPGNIEDWRDHDAEVVVIHSWETSRLHVASVDKDHLIVEFTGPAAWPFTQWDPYQRYYVENIPQALDAPGEWYLDRKTGTVSYIPLPDENMEKAEVIAPRLSQFVLFTGDPEHGKFVSNITLSGLSFAYSTWNLPETGYSDSQAAHSVPVVIEMKGARLCSIEKCEIAHIGTYAIRVKRGSHDIRLEQNHIHDLGAGGVCIGEMAIDKDPELAVARVLVNNNYIHDGGHVYESAVGVWIGQSSDNTISHNEISDIGYTGVSVGWTWGYGDSGAQRNIIERNHIHHIGYGNLSDMGGIYTLGTSTGSILRYNHIHHVTSYHYGGWGIYPDEGTSYMLIENNVVHDTKTGGFHQHYGKENVVRNNIFARSLGEQVIRSRAEEHRSFTFARNIVYYDKGSLLGSKWDDDHFYLDYNLYWKAGGEPVEFKGMSLADWQAKKNMDWHSVVADPLFVKAERDDFSLKTHSPARALGFEEIDLSETGLVGPQEWRSLPKQFTKHLQIWP